MADIITGKVIQKIDDYRIVINKGSKDGVKSDSVFLVYRLGDEMFDPDTKESLGELELICGEGTPEHIQEKLTTIYTSKKQVKKTKTVIKRGGWNAIYGDTEETYDPEVIDIPFENVDTDCIVRQIK